MSGESDIAKLAGFTRLDQCGVGAIFGEDAMWILKANNLMMLDQVDAVDLKSFE